MVMAVSLLVDRASAENWIFWNYQAYSDDGKYHRYPEKLGAFDSYASCKAEENSKCESIGYLCKKVSGGICDKTQKVSTWLQYGKPASDNYYDCWKCYPQGMPPGSH
jgi:hypothetical protein